MTKPLKEPKIDIAAQSDEGLQNIIDNHWANEATDRPLYFEALAELNRRQGEGLDFVKTLALVRERAAQRRFISYGEIAEANGLDWNAVRYPMNTHLWRLVEYAHSKGWPMLSAIIVNKQNVGTGEMEESTLKGFIEAAKELGYAPADATAFLKDQQEACFEWALSGDS